MFFLEIAPFPMCSAFHYSMWCQRNEWASVICVVFMVSVVGQLVEFGRPTRSNDLITSFAPGATRVLIF